MGITLRRTRVEIIDGIRISPMVIRRSERKPLSPVPHDAAEEVESLLTLSKRPETHQLSQDQLVAEIKGIYASLVSRVKMYRGG